MLSAIGSFTLHGAAGPYAAMNIARRRHGRGRSGAFPIEWKRGRLSDVD